MFPARRRVGSSAFTRISPTVSPLLGSLDWGSDFPAWYLHFDCATLRPTDDDAGAGNYLLYLPFHAKLLALLSTSSGNPGNSALAPAAFPAGGNMSQIAIRAQVGCSCQRNSPTTSIKTKSATETINNCFRSEKTRLYSTFQSA